MNYLYFTQYSDQINIINYHTKKNIKPTIKQQKLYLSHLLNHIYDIFSVYGLAYILITFTYSSTLIP